MSTKTRERLQITEAEADFLNKVSHAAYQYRKALEETQDRAKTEVERLNAATNIYGLGHQNLFEVVRYYGELQALLDMSRMFFYRPGIDDISTEVLANRFKDVSYWISLAMKEDMEGTSITRQHYYFVDSDKWLEWYGEKK